MWKILFVLFQRMQCYYSRDEMSARGWCVDRECNVSFFHFEITTRITARFSINANIREILPGPSNSSDREDECLDFSGSCSSYHPSSSSDEGSCDSNSIVVPKKRKLNKEGWKKIIRKNRRARGRAYIGAQGHQKSGKPMLPAPCKDKPNHSNCNSFDEASRKSLYAAFRALGNIDDQRKFINKHIQNKVKARNTRHLTESRRNYTASYHFTVKGEMVKVCREFFLSTLNITDSLIRSTISKTNDQGCVEMNKRGKHAPHNKLPESQATFLKKHITSFPAVESHYCRKSTGRRYSDPCLNVQSM